MQNEVRFRQIRPQGMMREASVFARVRSLQRSLLSSVAFKHRGIQVQAVAPFPLGQSLHLPGPQRRVESVILSLPKTLEPVADGIVGREPSNPQHLLQGRQSARSSPVCAKRRAPANTDSKNAVNVCTGSIALGEVKRNGRCCRTASAEPIFPKNSPNTTKPPNGVTARFVSRNSTSFPPQIGVICSRTVLFLLDRKSTRL